ncbi:hypothetical protein QYF36_008879 [Acer negundo]|nr:hypothetical protein QYF36_008879 [Acer negundo]
MEKPMQSIKNAVENQMPLKSDQGLSPRMKISASGALKIDIVKPNYKKSQLDRNCRYKKICCIGNGYLGVIYKCHDSLTNRVVAVTEKFSYSNSSSMITGDQISLLRELHHDNIVTFYDVCYDDVTNDVTLALEYLDTDLSHLIKSPTWNSSLTKKFMYQILQGVSRLHSLNIIHRDLRPGNLLVKFQENIVKIAFGLAEKDIPVDEDYNWIGDLKYAAPEIIFGLTSYSAASASVDMWSVGCIFAEMVMKEPLFNGDWTEMYCWFVTPEEADSGPKVTSLPVALAGKVSCLESDGFDLLSKMLCKNPAKRITTGDAIAHPYFADIVNA